MFYLSSDRLFSLKLWIFPVLGMTSDFLNCIQSILDITLCYSSFFWGRYYSVRFNLLFLFIASGLHIEVWHEERGMGVYIQLLLGSFLVHLAKVEHFPPNVM